MAFLPSIFGRKEKLSQLPRYTPAQQSALDQLLQQSLGGLRGLLQPQGMQFDFAPIAQQARSQFEQQTIPTLAERFTGLTSGRLSSPSFAQQLGAAGAGLEQGLASLQAQYGLQQQQLGQRERAMQLQALLSLLSSGLQPQFDIGIRPGQSGLLGGLLGASGQAFGTALPLFGLSSLFGGIS